MRASPRRWVARVLDASSAGLAVEVPDWPGHQPGQFAMLSLDPSGHYHDPLLPRPMAIFRGDASRLEFRFRVVGRGTARMAELVPGALLGLVGPLGQGFPVPEGPAVLVGGGTGIVSLYELAAAHAPGVRVLLGGRSVDDILGLAEFQALGLRLGLTTDDGSLGHAGVVTDLLEPKPGETVYACGPDGMLRQAHRRAREAGCRCWVSMETQMACGFGVCLGCVIPTALGFRYVCTDGPVFDAEELCWQTGGDDRVDA